MKKTKTAQRRDDLLLKEVPWKALLYFAVPIYFAVLFQQVYGFLDGYWLSRYAPAGFTAVSLCGYFVYFGTTFSSGFASGIANRTAQAFGLNDQTKVRSSLATSLSLGVIVGILVSAVMVALVEPLLAFGNVPNGAILEQSRIYLYLILGASLLGILLQSLGVSLFRSLGAKRESFFVMVFYVLCNILLDYLLVVMAGLSALGVGLAYALSQYLSAGFAFVLFYFRFPEYRLHKADFRFDRIEVGLHLKPALLFALQNSVIGVGLFFLQRSLNAFGQEEIDGYSLANRLYGYLGIFEAALSSSLMFYTAQNYGKKDPIRLKKGLSQNFILGAFLALISIGIGFLFRDSFYSLFFNRADHSDNYASYQTTLLYFLPSFFLSIALNSFRSFFFGVNKPLTAFLSTVVETFFRLLFAIVLTPYLGFYGVPLSDMVAWGATSAFCVIAYLIERKKIYTEKI